MKKILCLLTILSLQTLFANSPITEHKKIESLIKIWGLLKYQHPEVSKGTFNFNEEFITECEQLENITTQEELNAALLQWIKKFDLRKSKFKTNPKLLSKNNIFKKSADDAWIENSDFSTELVEILNQIKNNTAIGKHYAYLSILNKMVAFDNDRAPDHFDVTKKSNRLLFLGSYWNIMKYWNVNLYLTTQNWSDVLQEMIPEFIVNDPIKFEVAKEKLFTKINDTHSDYSYSYTLGKLLKRFPDVSGRIVNDSLVITKLQNNYSGKKHELDLGDVIYAIEGKNIRDYYTDKFSNVISSSNPTYLKSYIEKYLILSNTTDSIQIAVQKKDGSSQVRYLKLYSKILYRYDISNFASAENSYTLSDSVGYINLDKITKPELQKVFSDFASKKAIVLDLRNHPKTYRARDITASLFAKKRIFITQLGPHLPAYGEYGIKAPLRLFGNPFATGKSNKDHYKGKIILLVDRSTVSNAEFIAMAIQQYPNCITIGEQTGGAVMNRIQVPLMDKTTIDFTGMGAFYPDGGGVQRNGVKIDYEIKESAANYNPNLYIEEALKIIEQ